MAGPSVGVSAEQVLVPEARQAIVACMIAWEAARVGLAWDWFRFNQAPVMIARPWAEHADATTHENTCASDLVLLRICVPWRRQASVAFSV